MAHYDVEFPRNIAEGGQAILTRRTDVVTLASGHEETNQRWTHARRTYAAGLGIRSADDLAAVVALWQEVRGRANSFRFRDWTDWRSGFPSAPIAPTDQGIGTGDGVETVFQLVKTYGVLAPYARPIYCPHPTSVRVALDGVEALSGWSLGSTGAITFTAAPSAGVAITAGFSFDVPVRFADDALTLSMAFFEAGGAGVGEAPDITLSEVRLA